MPADVEVEKREGSHGGAPRESRTEGKGKSGKRKAENGKVKALETWRVEQVSRAGSFGKDLLEVTLLEVFDLQRLVAVERGETGGQDSQEAAKELKG